MAYEFSLEMVSSLNASQAKRLLADRLNAELSGEGIVHTRDISIGGGDIEPGHWTEVAEECFHFTPSWTMGFRARYDGDRNEFHRLMLRGALLLLEHGGDAVLLVHGEHIIFQRSAGKLVFNTDMVVTLDKAMLEEEIHIPYEWRSLPSPLLR